MEETKAEFSAENIRHDTRAGKVKTVSRELVVYRSRSVGPMTEAETTCALQILYYACRVEARNPNCPDYDPTNVCISAVLAALSLLFALLADKRILDEAAANHGYKIVYLTSTYATVHATFSGDRGDHG